MLLEHIVYNELDRGEYKTNYAGYDTIKLHVPFPPNLTSVYRNESGNNLKLHVSGGGLYHISTLLGEQLMDISGTNTTKNIQLDNSTSGIIAYDTTGDATTMYSENMLIDSIPPKVNITYSDGTYTITVSDNESGIWKITDRNDTNIYHDYS